MKKMVIMLWAFTCVLFLEGCTIGQKNDTSANRTGTLESQIGDKMEQPNDAQQNDMQQDAEPEVQNNQVEPEVQNNQVEPKVQNNQVSGSASEMQMLELGNMENLGLGYLVCTVPGKEDEDYKLYFFSTESESADRYKSFSETEFDLEAADYVFPDVREGNAPIGRFLDIYFFDITEIRDAGRDFIIIARYDVDGKNCYDTRAYMQSGKSYCVDEELMQELNEKYRDVEEYPIIELFEMPHD